MPLAPPCLRLGSQCSSLKVTLRIGSLTDGAASLDHEATWLLGHTGRITFRELWEGWSQSFYVLFGGRPWQVVAHAVAILAWAVLPFVALIPAFSFAFWGLDMVHGWWDVAFAASAILAVVTILQSASVVRRVHRQSHFYTATLPLAGLCLAAAAVAGCVREAAWRTPPVQDSGRSDTATIRSLTRE